MIQIICIFVPLLFMTAFMPVLLRKYPRKCNQRLTFYIFVIYVLGNLYFTLLSRVPDSGQYLELQPFRSLGRLFESIPDGESVATGFAAVFLKGTFPIVGIILNIFLYYPLGYMLPILFPTLKPLHIVLIGCLCSVATELVQLGLKMGYCETDDVIHNTLGTAIGVWVWLWQSKRLNAQRGSNSGKGET